MTTPEKEIGDILAIKLKGFIQKAVKGTVNVKVKKDKYSCYILKIDIENDYYPVSFTVDRLHEIANRAWTAEDLGRLILARYRKRINNAFFY